MNSMVIQQYNGRGAVNMMTVYVGCIAFSQPIFGKTSKINIKVLHVGEFS
jgi:hypothetical protein